MDDLFACIYPILVSLILGMVDQLLLATFLVSETMMIGIALDVDWLEVGCSLGVPHPKGAPLRTGEKLFAS